MEYLPGLMIVAVVMSVYLLPAFIAMHRHHKNTTPVVLFNIFLGWSFIGWVIALVWAFSNQDNQIVYVVRREEP